jgi:outer membrane protein OmpA-like peptidoglycan-associated protein
MKNYYKILVACAFMLSATFASAQNDENRWSFAVGVNAIDLWPVGDTDNGTGEYFDQFLDVSHYNILPAPSRFEIGYYVGDGIVATGAFSVNSIDRRGNLRLPEELTYVSIDGGLRYNLSELWTSSPALFSPYLGVGGSYQWLEDDGFGTFNGTAGFDIALTERVAFNLQTTYKHAFEDQFPSHFQHTAGIKFIWGAVDTDDDGIVDSKDECPTEAGLVEFNGCPDSDGDGIKDSEDECPNDFGPAENNGCPDTDGDGVLDKDDKCPDEAGEASLMGCPDSDGDGIADGDDECPNTAGIAKFNGCPDTDGDGIKDSEDKCPNEAGVRELQGCPKPKAPPVEVQNQLNEYAATVNFDTGKSSITKDSEAVLDKIVDILNEYPDAKFSVDGHTDSVGRASSNKRLSEARALSVKEYLVGHGVDEFRLSSKGYGEDQPIADNKTKAGRAQNRRVEINLVKN